jgi:hypothetical protein
LEFIWNEQLGYISIVNSNCTTHSSQVKNAARETVRVIFGHDVSDDISNSVMVWQMKIKKNEIM